MIQGVTSNFFSVTIIRIISRILQFILRVYLIRNTLTPQILTSLLTLDLILTTSLHLSKSCFKPSYQQVQYQDKKENIVSGMNLMTMGIGTTVVSGIFACVWRWNQETEVIYIQEAIILYWVSGIIESFRQKYAVEFVLAYDYKKMSLIELFSYLPKTLFIFLAANFGAFQIYGILVFGFGQLIFYLINLLATLAMCSNHQPLFQKIGERGYLDPKTKKTLKQRIYLSIIKLLLQEFEKIILVLKHVVSVSSIYTLVSNFGSIAVRFIFAPLEEIAFNYFSRGNQQQAKNTFLTILKNIFIFSLICLTYGFTYSENVLYIVYGEKWTNSQSVQAFQSYFFLLAIIGLNGTMEAYLMAKADPNLTIPKFKYFSILSTSVYLLSSFTLMEYGLGASGIFIGNGIGMMVRIVVSWKLEICQHMTLKQLVKGVLPKKIFFVLLFLFMVSIQQIRATALFNHYVDLGVGIVLFTINVSPVIWEYKQQIISIIKK